MIVDNLSNAANYFSLHPLFEKAFEHVKALDFNNLNTGTEEVDGAFLKVIVTLANLKPASEAKLETHRKYIDIQIPVTREETFGWSALANLKDSVKGYDAENDFELFNDTPTAYVSLLPGEFVIFSPEDGHAPLIGEGETKKIIIKVAVI
ncbi:MAG: YhcH/YjgK/YiaL family protein [Petrimonas sp.]|nr:YhcH/YjgK/YiaL family protein [Petrimonas sp.]